MVVMANVRSYPFPPPLRMQATQTRGTKAPQPEASLSQALGACSKASLSQALGACSKASLSQALGACTNQNQGNENKSNENKGKTPDSSFQTGACSSDGATSSVTTVPEGEQASTPCSGCTLGADAPQDQEVLAPRVPRGLSYCCCAHGVPVGLFYSSLCASCRVAYRSPCCAHAGTLVASLYLLSSLATVLSSVATVLSSYCVPLGTPTARHTVLVATKGVETCGQSRWR